MSTLPNKPFQVTTQHQTGDIGFPYLRLYQQLATNPLPRSLSYYPPAVTPLLELVYSGQQLPSLLSGHYPIKTRGKGNPSLAAVAFSGGKDSVAAALRLRSLGKEVILVHVGGINRATKSDELSAASDLSSVLNMPLRIMTVLQAGQMGWVENPIRNNLILALAADWLVDSEGVRTFALGTMRNHHFDPNNKDVGLSDCVEVMDATAAALAQDIEGFELHHLLDSNSHSMRTVMDGAPQALPLIRSCLTRKVFRTAHANRIARTYGIKLMEGRCGVCQKCASEWLHLSAWGHIKSCEAFEHYCCDTLHRRYEQNYIGRSAARAEAIRYFLDVATYPELGKFLDY